MRPETVTLEAFRALLERLAAAWAALDADAGVDCFEPDAVYMEPPDRQLFRGHDELRAYFGAVPEGTFMTWHRVWYDPAEAVGAGEFTFGSEGSEQADHGIAVVNVRNGRIARWEEYHRPGPRDPEAFLGVDGKNWQWHIGNYP